MEKVSLDEVKIERDGGNDDERNKRIGLGCLTVVAGVGFLIALAVGIPLIAALYRWAFGG